MEVKSAKGLGSGRRILIDLKKKRATKWAANFTHAARKSMAQRTTSDQPAESCKRVRSGDCKNNCRCRFRKSVLKNYSNFMKSGLPQRLLTYRNGEWTDFPREVIALVKYDFKSRKAITEVSIQGSRSLIDFLHMVQIDLETGLQQPIAWIDENDACFFPEVYSDIDESLGCCGSHGEEDQSDICPESNRTREIHLQLDIAIGAADSSKSEESDIPCVKRLKVTEEPSSNCYELEQSSAASDKYNAEIKEVIGENQPVAFSTFQNAGLGFDDGCLARLVSGGRDYESVKNMLLVGLGQFIDADNIVGIYGALSSDSMKTQYQLFQKQVEITTKSRGNANVKYAWFGASKGVIKEIMLNGFRHDWLPKAYPSYGVGIHLTPVNCSHVSARYSDVDENGTRHMVLCRVILGNMELVHPGSEQFHPSREVFDSGVDDIWNPKHYIIWKTYMNTHIYPQYAVSFRIPPSAEDSLVGKEGKFDKSGVFSQVQQHALPINLVGESRGFSSSVEQPEQKPGGCDLKAAKIPKSPWMPFSVLLAAISPKISSEEVKLLNLRYNEFKRKEISRAQFIIMLRQITGDKLLRSAIEDLHLKPRGFGNLACRIVIKAAYACWIVIKAAYACRIVIKAAYSTMCFLSLNICSCCPLQTGQSWQQLGICLVFQVGTWKDQPKCSAFNGQDFQQRQVIQVAAGIALPLAMLVYIVCDDFSSNAVPSNESMAGEVAIAELVEISNPLWRIAQDHEVEVKMGLGIMTGTAAAEAVTGFNWFCMDELLQRVEVQVVCRD
ncbi:hypothetical protein ACLOJK_028319 [Asimina triloba]